MRDLIEHERRKPGARGGLVRLADGQPWLLAEPAFRPGPDGLTTPDVDAALDRFYEQIVLGDDVSLADVQAVARDAPPGELRPVRRRGRRPARGRARRRGRGARQGRPRIAVRAGSPGPRLRRLGPGQPPGQRPGPLRDPGLGDQRRPHHPDGHQPDRPALPVRRRLPGGPRPGFPGAPRLMDERPTPDLTRREGVRAFPITLADGNDWGLALPSTTPQAEGRGGRRRPGTTRRDRSASRRSSAIRSRSAASSMTSDPPARGTRRSRDTRPCSAWPPP